MENGITTFEYKGYPVTFFNKNGMYVNATEMAKMFGKMPANWFDNPGTEEFIDALAKHRGIEAIPLKRITLNTKYIAEKYPSLVKVVQGGLGKQGTWFDEDLAIEFARWLSPEFAIWCNDRIKELMKFGVTATTQAMEQMINNPDAFIAALQALKKEREEKSVLAEENKKKQILIERNQPKVLFASAVESSKDDILIRDLAKILKQNGIDIGERRLFDLLKKDGYLTVNNTPTQKSMELGIMKIKESPYFAGTETRISLTTKITGKGQIYFCKKYLDRSVQNCTVITNS